MSTQSSNEEQTFRAYTPSDAELYAKHRHRYSDALYETIFSYHTSNGGRLGTVVDLGCGPGTATFKLAETFEETIGLDPSQGMITTARSLAAEKHKTFGGASGQPAVRFEVSKAEDISADLIPDGSVDLITAATCAHWFDHAPFYHAAARLLRPNGTLALWTSRHANVHPETPNAAAISAALKEIETAELLPFRARGNLLAHELYATLPMPWTTGEPAFPKAGFRRIVFGLEEGTEGAEEGVVSTTASFFEGGSEARWLDLDTMERMLATASPVARWREANAAKVGTEDDVVRRMRRVAEKLLHEAGVEEGKELMRGGMEGVLLMFKKAQA